MPKHEIKVYLRGHKAAVLCLSLCLRMGTVMIELKIPSIPSRTRGCIFNQETEQVRFFFNQIIMTHYLLIFKNGDSSMLKQKKVSFSQHFPFVFFWKTNILQLSLQSTFIENKLLSLYVRSLNFTWTTYYFLNLQKRNQGLNLSQMSHIASKTTNKDALLFMKNIRIGIKTAPDG